MRMKRFVCVWCSFSCFPEDTNQLPVLLRDSVTKSSSETWPHDKEIAEFLKWGYVSCWETFPHTTELTKYCDHYPFLTPTVPLYLQSRTDDVAFPSQKVARGVEVGVSFHPGDWSLIPDTWAVTSMSILRRVTVWWDTRQEITSFNRSSGPAWFSQWSNRVQVVLLTTGVLVLCQENIKCFSYPWLRSVSAV